MILTLRFRDKVSAFYTAANRSGGLTCFFIYATGTPDTLAFTDCFDPLKYKGYFIFLSSQPILKTLIPTLKKLIPAAPLPHTQLLWIRAADPASATTDDLILLQLDKEGVQQNDISAAWGKYGISIPAGSKVMAELRESISGLSWTLPMDPVQPQPQPFFLPLHGDNSGLLISRASIADFSDASGTGWDVGFRYFMKDAAEEEIISQYYPLFHPEENTNVLFKLAWDPTSSKRTTLEFEALSFIMDPSADQPGGYLLRMPAKPERLRTWLRTDMGLTVYLYPLSNKLMPGQGAKLVLAALPGGGYYWSPEGCFELGLETDRTSPSTHYLLCGLSGVETMSFQPRSAVTHGDVLRFEGGKPAFVYNFPGTDKIISQPSGLQKRKRKNAPHAPGDLYIAYSKSRMEMPAAGPDPSSYLDNTYQTSWMKIRSFTGANQGVNYYYAQPASSALYGGATGLYNWRQYAAPGQTAAQEYSFMPFFRPPSAVLSTFSKKTNILFPMAPVAGALANPATHSLHPGPAATFLSFFEEQVMSPSRTEQVMKGQPKRRDVLRKGPKDASSYSTSPQGLLVKISTTDFKWNELLFACSQKDPSPEGKLSFTDLSDKLTAAFQTKQLFLVMSVLPQSDRAAFKNKIDIQGWPFAINVPESTVGSEYSNVLIFKFAPGSLKDLLADYSRWTSVNDFNTNPAGVSKYLSDYITPNPSTLYDHFNELVNSETWTGVLALNLDLDLKGFPEQIKGLIGGIDLQKFNAHHLGIEVSQVVPDTVKGGLKFTEPSSLFALIDYEETQPAVNDLPFDFKVDLLQVLFRNNTITDFRCNISLKLGRLFGEEVRFDPAPRQPSTIELNGTYEKHEGVASYSFLSKEQYVLSSIKGIVWKSITLSKIQFFTLSQLDNTVNSVFSFWGDLIFNDIDRKKEIKEDKSHFDLFSFDKLSFSGMQLLMNFSTVPPKAPAKTTLNFTFEPSAITFNNSTSIPRKASLFLNFPLDAKGMVSGNESNLPSGKGYYPIELPLKYPHEINSTWYALRYDLDLGTPGALAEKAGFTASILACWTPQTDTSQTQIAAYLQLPGGSGLFQTTLQSALTLSVGDAKFSSPIPVGLENPVYRLALNSIVLKVLGYSIPPNGATNASLFSNVDQAGKKSSTGWYIAYNKKK